MLAGDLLTAWRATALSASAPSAFVVVACSTGQVSGLAALVASGLMALISRPSSLSREICAGARQGALLRSNVLFIFTARLGHGLKATYVFVGGYTYLDADHGIDIVQHLQPV